jgi:DNA-binding transcriptional ArsR family regulator
MSHKKDSMSRKRPYVRYLLMSPPSKHSCESRWDPSGFRLDHDVVNGMATVSRRKFRMVRKTGELFLRGPIPMHWLHAAAKLGVSALWVACVLWHLAGLKRSSTFLVSNLHLHRWGIERRTKSRALKALSHAGLITVVGRGKRAAKWRRLSRCHTKRAPTEASALTTYSGV